MEKKQTNIGWALWLQWVLATTVGWIVGMALFSMLVNILSNITGDNTGVIVWSILGTIPGSVIGMNQWIVLNLFSFSKDEPGGKWWVIVTIFGWSISLAIVVGLGVGERIGFTISGAVIGISVGIAQWFVLRSRVKRSEWWGLINTASWILGLSLIDLLDQAIGFALAGVVSGALTGACLVWLLRNPASEDEETEIDVVPKEAKEI